MKFGPGPEKFKPVANLKVKVGSQKARPGALKLHKSDLLCRSQVITEAKWLDFKSPIILGSVQLYPRSNRNEVGFNYSWNGPRPEPVARA